MEGKRIKSPVFTVFTATYNRARLLPDVYEALLAQTMRSFEWLIVDDGSNDGTRLLVEKWSNEREIPIRYHFKANGGPHTAHNVALKLAAGEFFLRHDSDDLCVPTALERFYDCWMEIPDVRKSEFSGVNCLCMDSSGKTIGDPFPGSPCDGNPIDFIGLRGEKWGFHKSAVLRDFPFPEYPGERFVPEGLVWNRIGSRYKSRCINEPLRIVRQSRDSITKSMEAVRYSSPRGTMAYYLELMSYRISIGMRLRAAINLVRFSIGSKCFLAAFQNHRRRFLISSIYPLGLVLFLRDRLLGKYE